LGTIPELDMHRFTTLLTAAAFAIHMVIGCCWHHDHGACEHGVCEHEAGHELAESADGGHDLGFSEGHAHHHHCPDHHQGPCHGTPCVAVQESQATVPVIHEFSIFLADLPAKATPTAESVGQQGGFTVTEDVSPPLRRHLMLQVLRT
jgi:hypothetical protein